MFGVFFLCGSAVCLAQHSTPRINDIVLDGNVRIVDLPGNSPAVHRAVMDLSHDIQKVLGTAPVIFSSVGAAKGVTIEISQGGGTQKVGECDHPSSRESFAFSHHRAGATTLLCLAGADMRGTIFAVYEFSQSYLGVDPMYQWTDKEPAKQQSVVLPSSFDKTYPSPVFKYRGFFINDEDLLTGWAPAKPNQQTSISPAAWDKVFETILRLKGDMVVPGTWTFPDDLQWKLAADRGLILSQHHATPLDLNASRWPAGVPYNYTAHPEILEKAWKNAVDQSVPNADILWTVGLRGLSDIGYDAMDPSVRGNDSALGALISKAIAKQIEIVRRHDPKAEFISDLWSEGARLMKAGVLKVPPEVTLVWADTGYGLLQDRGTVKAGEGAYYHVAMMNNSANQLSEMVPVARIQSELDRYESAKATNYLLLNTSDIRPVAMTARAFMERGWAGSPKGGGTDRDYYRKWSAEEFGQPAADAITDVYQQYFAAPALLGKDKHEAGDQFYHTEIRFLLGETMNETPLVYLPDQAPKWTVPRLLSYPDRQHLAERLQQDIKLCTEAQPRWDTVWNLANSAKANVPVDRRLYYQAGVLTMIEINRESNLALLKVAQSLASKLAGDAAAAEHTASEASAALGAVQDAKKLAEYGQWKNWYRGDWLVGVPRTQEVVSAYARRLQDPYAPLTPPLDWNDWEAYHYIQLYQGERTIDVR